MTGNIKESRARANAGVRRRIVVGITFVVDIAHTGSRPATDGTQPPVNTLFKVQRVAILTLANQFHTLSCAFD